MESNNPDALIRTILEAEDEAGAVVADCERRAADLEAEAREKARRIAETTDERIRRLQANREETSPESAGMDTVSALSMTDAQLEQAADCLAAELLETDTHG